MRVRAGGLTLLEMLLVLALVAVAAGAVALALRPAAELRAAQALRGLLIAARHEALLRGASVAVVGSTLGFVATAQAGDGAECAGGVDLAGLRLAEHPGVRVVSAWPTGGVVWLPSGSGRTCAGGGVISSTVVLEGVRGSAAVIVSSLGRVRVERR